MKYSQNNEEQIIGNYFGAFRGHLLSLGENDGVTLSNSRALIELGWTADLVEPAKKPFQDLLKLYESVETVRLHNLAVGDKTGRETFYDSGTLLNQGDVSLVSTLVKEETKRWIGAVDFSIEEVTVVTFTKLLDDCLHKIFDFISIDCEGMDWIILQQMNLGELQCKCLCVEFNGKNEHMFSSYMSQFGMRLIHKNAENLIYVR